MILLGFGGNLPFGNYTVQQTITYAFAMMPNMNMRVKKISPLYSSAPVPVSDQPWFLNGVAAIDTDLAPEKLLHALIAIEEKCGRIRSIKNAARTLDLDLLDYRGLVFSNTVLDLPHPRIAERAFVLKPLCDVAPHWKHPVTGKTVHVLIDALPAQQKENCIRHV
jgi:2-amino-4-hydroxy-6-hydroxymethyldihydropteridine diphosphokinase